MFEDEGSDVDIFEEDEDTKADAFDIGETLSVPKTGIYKTKQLHELIHEGVIDIDPPYQRDVVWSVDKQSRLIDSIFRNYYIPPVVFVVTQDLHGNTTMRCVDGKQRLTSIQGFIDGRVPYRHPRSKKSYWYLVSEKHRTVRPEIPEYWKRQFLNKNVTCVEYKDLTDAMERDIFQRVQLGVSLTGAEKLQALSSPWADFISNLEARWITHEHGLIEKIDLDTKRARSFQSLAHFVYCCHGLPEQLVPTNPKMETFIKQIDGPSTEFQEKMHNVMNNFWKIAHKTELSHPFTKVQQRVAPVEFVFIGVLLFVMDDCTNKQRADETHKMRNFIRSYFPDVRARGDVFKKLWEFVIETIETYDLDVDYALPEQSKKRGKKRQIIKEYDELEEEEVQATLSRGKRSKTSW